MNLFVMIEEDAYLKRRTLPDRKSGEYIRQTSENVQRERNDYGSIITPFSGLQDRFEVIYIIRIEKVGRVIHFRNGLEKVNADDKGGIMAEREQQAAFLKEIQTRFDRKVKENEISLLEYWKEHVDRVAVLKPEGIAALQMQVRKISEMMANRIRTLKREQ